MTSRTDRTLKKNGMICISENLLNPNLNKSFPLPNKFHELNVTNIYFKLILLLHILMIG